MDNNTVHWIKEMFEFKPIRRLNVTHVAIIMAILVLWSGRCAKNVHRKQKSCNQSILERSPELKPFPLIV